MWNARHHVALGCNATKFICYCHCYFGGNGSCDGVGVIIFCCAVRAVVVVSVGADGGGFCCSLRCSCCCVLPLIMFW